MDSIYDKFTIIIPEHNRPDHTKRLLDYYLSYGVKIIVTDSSLSEFKYLNEYSNKIVYCFFPNIPLAEKLYYILPLIDTPYVTMCANDDFIVPQSINTIIEYLELHNQYNSGQGVYIDFSIDSNKIEKSLRYKNTMNINLNEDTSSKRLFSLCRNYFQYYYAVFKTAEFAQNITSIIQKEKTLIKNLCLLEFYMSSYSAISGNHIILPIFYSARENIKNSAASYTDSIPVIIQNDNYKTEYQDYITLLAKHLMQKEDITINSAQKVILESVDIYIKHSYPNYFSLKNRIKRVIKSFAKKHRINLPSTPTKTQKDTIPSTLRLYENWDTIEHYINKYLYIYNNNGRI